MDEKIKQLLDLSERVGKEVMTINHSLQKIATSDLSKRIIVFFQNLPDDLKETAIYKHIQRFEHDDISYEDVEWIWDEFGYMTYEDSVDVLIKKTDKTELDNYILYVLGLDGVSEKEKLIVLLAHFEQLVYQTMSYERKAKDRVKSIVSAEVKNAHEMKIENLEKLLICSIVFIVFSNTDNYKIDVDKRIPFRNNILHRGTLAYSIKDAKTAYEILVYFIAEIALLRD